MQIQNIKTCRTNDFKRQSVLENENLFKDRQNCTLDHMEGELPFFEGGCQYGPV